LSTRNTTAARGEGSKDNPRLGTGRVLVAEKLIRVFSINGVIGNGEKAGRAR